MRDRKGLRMLEPLLSWSNSKIQVITLAVAPSSNHCIGRIRRTCSALPMHGFVATSVPVAVAVIMPRRRDGALSMLRLHEHEWHQMVGDAWEGLSKQHGEGVAMDADN